MPSIPTSAIGAELRHSHPADFTLPRHLIQKQRSGQAVVLIDVRPAADFRTLRIPGAINVPLYSLKKKSFSSFV